MISDVLTVIKLGERYQASINYTQNFTKWTKINKCCTEAKRGHKDSNRKINFSKHLIVKFNHY